MATSSESNSGNSCFQGCGSAIAEIFLKQGEIRYEREEVDYDKPGTGRDRLLDLNPFAQVPTILLASAGTDPDGH